jgi:hypothetical protein
MSKISELSDGGSLVSTDYLIAVRSGGNVKVRMDEINVDQVDLGDNEFIRLGNSQDLTLVHNASNSIINQAGIGDLLIQKAGATKLTVNSTGIDITGDITLGDTNPTITFNDSSITNLSHTISSASDNLRITADVNGVDAGSRVEIFDGTTEVARFEAGAVDVTGTVTADGLTVDGTSAEVISVNSTANGSQIAFDSATTSSDWLVGIANDATDDFLIYQGGAGAGDIRLYTDGTERLTVLNGGNVGIGTSSPSGLMSFAKGSRTLDLKLEDTAATGDVGVQLRAGSGDYFGIAAGGGTGVGIVIDDSNNVGIGTSSPRYNLEVSSSSNTFVQIASTSTSALTGLLFGDTSNAVGRVTYDHSDNSLQLFTNTTEKARIDASGNLLVGKTSTGAATAGIELNGANDLLRIARDGGVLQELNRITNEGDIIEFRKDNTKVGSIGVASSRVYIGTDDTGLRFTNDEITPFNPSVSADRNGTVDLGGSSTRFKDLYLSGKAQADSYQFAQNSSATGATEAVYRPTTGEMAFKTNSSEAMRIDSAGNVGIGVTPESYQGLYRALQVGNTALIGRQSGGISETYLTANSYYDGAWKYIVSDEASVISQSAGVISFANAASGTADATISWSEAMRIDASGNVGIGTSSPLGQLHINTETAEATKVYVDGEANQPKSIEIRHYDTSEGSGAGRNLFYLKTPASDRLDIGNFTDGSTETQLMTFLESGNVGIGTSSPSRQLTVQSSGAQISLLSDTTGSSVINMGDTDDDNIGRIQYDNTNDKMLFRVNTSDVMTIDASGNVGIGTDAIDLTSSGRTVVQIEGSSNALLNLTDGTSRLYLHQKGGTSGADIWNSANSYMRFATNDTEVMRIDALGNIGIGETSIGSNALEIRRSGASGIALKETGVAQLIVEQDTDAKIRITNSKNLIFSGGTDGTTERMRIDANGNVGIGTSPSFPLHVSGSSTNYVMSETTGTGTSAGFRLKGDASADFTLFTTQGTNQFAIYDNANSAERMRIDSSGNVGIGTSTNLANGTLNVESNGTSVLQARSDTAGVNDGDTTVVVSRALNSTAGKWANAIYRGYSHAWSYGTNAATNEAMRIDSSGNVGIGTTSPTGLLHLSSSAPAFYMTDTTNNTEGVISMDNAGSLIFNADLNNEAGSSNIRFAVDGTERLRIDSSGNILQQGGSPEYHFGTTSASHYNWRIAAQESVDAGFEISSGTQSAGSDASNDTYTPRFVVKADTGNVGIGTTTVNRKLEVAGNNNAGSKANFIRITDTDTSATAANPQGGIEFYTSDTGNENVTASIVNLYAGSGAGSELTFNTAPNGASGVSERMRIDASGGIRAATGSRFLAASTGEATPDYSFTSDGSMGMYRVPGSLCFSTGGTERMRIDASGNLLVGKTSTGAATAGIELNGANDLLRIARNGGVLQELNRIGTGGTENGDLIEFRVNNAAVGSIACRSSGGNLQIHTNESGIDFGGDGYLPMRGSTITDNSLDIGSSSFRYKDLYRSGSTISTSDRNMKQDERDLTEAETRVAQACKGLLKAFRFIDAVEVDGDDARIHFGIIAQDLQAAFEAEGLDATKYAMFRPSTFTDDEGNEQARLGVCYENLLAFIIAAI